ncbi:neuronal acetylcholine receptor subunit alpha-2-like [Actinia tenebrosa]|uniref:Neuronal acetylcholine receptor subunit alpha-2-like n=1 Tax=Actinia tenebrosa TaxID=6105 RepID=A0A6P8IH20_ACTTE|nr:neuronal acetylcholine receptor subunit alpha-2-like [Actinia tenebrosa]XP_031566153.1 neuronal acetylcholine receptor subunit alpha-2-like [Actinia tenebrosa]
MFLPGLVLSACAFVLTSQFSDAVKMPNASSEHALRQELLTSYDRFVRPVLLPLTIVNVSFSLKLISLINVDNKNHMVTSKLLIKQIWHNPFLTWDKAKHDGIGQIRMSKDEIWVPDITLLNSASNPSRQTINHYESWVTVYSNGTNVWVSLAIHDSECQIKVQNFPFDKQKCVIDFASESYDTKFLDIQLLPESHTETQDTRQMSNEEWKIIENKIQLIKERGDCCSTPFAHVKLHLGMERIPTFYILYLLCPSAILSLLVFFSFIIPPDNGERIGFCSSRFFFLSVSIFFSSRICCRTIRETSLFLESSLL